MKFSTFDLFTILAASAFVVEATPLVPQPGSLQMSRRRAVDYVQPDVIKARKLRHRAVNYSVVPVYGGSSSTEAVAMATATTTVVETVEKTATPSALAMTVTDIVSEPAVTHTLDVTESLPKQTVTVKQESTVIISFNTPIPTTTTEVTVSFETLKSATTALITEAPTSTTQYYDNGQWHTSYPVKSFPTFSGWLNNSSTSASQATSWITTPTSTSSSWWEEEQAGKYITSSWQG